MEVVYQGPVRRYRRPLIVGGVLLSLVLGIGLLGLWGGVAAYTDPAPQPLPTTNLPQTELHELQRRLAGFQQGLRQERYSGPLVLSAAEINALLETTPAAKPLRDKLRIEIQGNQLVARVSLPLREIHPSWLASLLRGRFLNANAGLNVSLDQGRLDLRTEWLKIRSKPVPGFLLKQLRGRNLANQVNEDPRAAIGMEKLQRVEVANGKLFIYPARFEGDSG